MANKTLSQLLAQLASRIDSHNQEDGARGYLRILKEITGTDIIYAAKLHAQKAHVVVGLNGDENFDEFVYDLEKTPCDIASSGSACKFSPDVQQRFPEDLLLQDMNINGYIGLPLLDINGGTIGILVGLNHHKNIISKDDEILYQMVSQLIQIEFRKLLEDQEELNSFSEIEVSAQGDWSRFFYTVLENLPGNVAVIGKDEKFVYVNKAYASFMNLNPSDLVGKTITEIFPADIIDNYRKSDEIVYKSKKKYEYSYEVTHPEYPNHFFDVTKFPFINSQHEVYAIGMMSLDVTEKVKNEQKLVDEKIKNIQKSKLATVGEMTSSISHELGNPLTIIQGISEKIRLMQQRDLPLTNLSDDLEKIIKASQRMASLVNSLRMFSRDEAEKNFEQFKLTEILNISKDLTSHRMDLDQISYEVSDFDQSITINTQFVLLSQVIVNLILNAADAIANLDQRWIKVDIVDDAKNVSIRVIDSGKGLDSKIASEIFKPFYTTKELEKGTGLGLSLSKEIAEKHNGTLDYELFEGNTSFKLVIPKL